MNRRFQLLPDNEDHQRLRVSQSLVDIHLEEYRAVIATKLSPQGKIS